MSMKTAQDIIQEALSYRCNEEIREKQSVLDRLFDFSTWGKKYEEKGNSSALLYLSERVSNEMKLREEAERKEQMAYRKALTCVEIYGMEAVRKFNEMWNDERFNPHP